MSFEIFNCIVSHVICEHSIVEYCSTRISEKRMFVQSTDMLEIRVLVVLRNLGYLILILVT